MIIFLTAILLFAFSLVHSVFPRDLITGIGSRRGERAKWTGGFMDIDGKKFLGFVSWFLTLCFMGFFLGGFSWPFLLHGCVASRREAG